MKKVLTIILFAILFPVFVLGTDKIDINTATLGQLGEIVHVGDKTAQKIIDGRPYGSVQDLSRVKGIGNGKYLQDIINQGVACVNCQTTLAPTATPIISPTMTSTPSPITSPIATPAIIYPAGVFINEIMPNPKGADETDEWIELYNSNSSDVDLSGWQIQDIEGTPTTFIIPKNTNISANNFLVFKRPDTKIMLNNDKDGLNLLTPDKKIVDSVNYVSAPLNQSYNKSNSGWVWSTVLTPGAKNIITALAAKVTAKTLSKAKNSVKNEVKDSGLADISQSINQDNKEINPWFLFFAVLSITIILSVIVLIIKLRFNNHVRT